jgi:hypothetical protein
MRYLFLGKTALVLGVVFGAIALGLASSACSTDVQDPEPSESTESSEPAAPLGSVQLALSPNDPVSAAVSGSCSTTSVKGLASQLVAEIQCLRRNALKSIAALPGLSLGPAVFPYLQPPAADALAKVQRARGSKLAINSALRTLPQQFLLYRWYQLGRCGISLAASRGTSNHESALAVDVEDADGWRKYFTGNSFRWLGAKDPVHYEYTGAGALDIQGLSVQAFQRLWNRNNPSDMIAEDGDYGDATGTRLAKAPVGGFAKGARCEAAPKDAGADATGPATGAAGPGADASMPPLNPYVPKEVPDAPENVEATVAEKSSGCGCSARPATRGSALLSLVLVFGAMRARKRAARV